MPLQTQPALERPDLLATPVLDALQSMKPEVRDEWEVGEIDPELADTAAFCDRYGVALEQSANCVVLAARRAERSWFAACVVLATTRADVNNFVRRHIDARKISFASMDAAVEATGMEYGGITPVGLPADWPILIDSRVLQQPRVVVGSGVRRSKLWVPPARLSDLPNAEVLEGLAGVNE